MNVVERDDDIIILHTQQVKEELYPVNFRAGEENSRMQEERKTDTASNTCSPDSERASRTYENGNVDAREVANFSDHIAKSLDNGPDSDTNSINCNSVSTIDETKKNENLRNTVTELNQNLEGLIILRNNDQTVCVDSQTQVDSKQKLTTTLDKTEEESAIHIQEAVVPRVDEKEERKIKQEAEVLHYVNEFTSGMKKMELIGCAGKSRRKPRVKFKLQTIVRSNSLEHKLKKMWEIVLFCFPEKLQKKEWEFVSYLKASKTLRKRWEFVNY